MRENKKEEEETKAKGSICFKKYQNIFMQLPVSYEEYPKRKKQQNVYPYVNKSIIFINDVFFNPLTTELFGENI